MNDRDLKCWQRILLSRPLAFVLPTATTLYYNNHRLSGEPERAKLPPRRWAQQEAKELLSRSDERLRSLEAKGPGLATVVAVVAAGVVAAIIEGGDDATFVGKVLLGIAAWYAIWSLFVPIYPRRAAKTRHHRRPRPRKREDEGRRRAVPRRPGPDGRPSQRASRATGRQPSGRRTERARRCTRRARRLAGARSSSRAFEERRVVW
jgi:hypothetical protein